MERRVRLKDIAERVGVDKSTVSMALRGHPRIPEVTRERVKAVAAAMGYVRDPALSRLAEQRWAGSSNQRAVSVALLAWRKDDYPDWRKELAGPLKQTALVLGYGFETVTVDSCGGVAAAMRVLEARGVAGLVVVASKDPCAWEGFAWEGFSGVEVLSGAGRRTGLATIRIDTIAALLDAGRRVEAVRPSSAAVALLQQDPPSLTDERDEAAALLVSRRWRAAGIRCADPKIFYNSPAMHYRLIDWLKAERPEVAILPNGGIYWLLPSSGLRVPEELRLIAHRRHGESAIAGYEQDTSRMGELAVQLLDAMIRANRRGLPERPETSVVGGKWVAGPSF